VRDLFDVRYTVALNESASDQLLPDYTTMKRFKLIIFDMDGLLIDSERIALEQFMLTLDEFAIEVERQVYLQCIGANARRVDEILSAAISSQTDYHAFKHSWRQKYKHRIANHPIPVKDGVEELTRHIRANQQPMAVATSTETPQAVEKLRNAGLIDTFDAIIGGEQVTASKPAPDLFLRAAQEFKAPPQQCLVLEDSINGVNAALNAGMRVVHVPDLVPPIQSAAWKQVIVLNNLREVIDHAF
jgi:HAD superfamily hydrolase (TIGR01509 family)